MVELQEEERGLCFKCGDKFSPDHKHAKKQLNMLVVEELGEGDEEEFLMCRVEKIGEDEIKEVEGPKEELELSINAMTGDFNHSTIRIHGKVKNKAYQSCWILAAVRVS